MDRRTLLAAVLVAIGGSVAGCLESGDTSGDFTDGGTDGADDAGMNDSSNETSDDSDDRPDRDSNHDGEGIRETGFEVLGSDFEFEISASATFKGDMVAITGTIQGNNTCYTARLDQVAMENRTLIVNVESYDDADEDEVCGEAPIGIDYEAVVKFHGDPPSAVTINHNGEKVITKQRS